MIWLHAIGAGVIVHYAFGLTDIAAAVFMLLAALSYLADKAKDRHKELIAAVKLAGETSEERAAREKGSRVTNSGSAQQPYKEA